MRKIDMYRLWLRMCSALVAVHAEQILSRRFANRGHSRMPHLPLRGDRVKADDNAFGRANFVKSIPP